MLKKKTLLILMVSLVFLLTAAACGGPEPVQPSLGADTQPEHSGSEPSPEVPENSAPGSEAPSDPPESDPGVPADAPATPSPAPSSAPAVSAGSSAGETDDFRSLSDAELMAFLLDEADGAYAEGAQYELGERLLARPADVLAAMAQYEGCPVQRWPGYSGDGAQWLADALASEFAVMRGGADDAALQAALDGQSGALVQRILGQDSSPAGIAQAVYDQLSGADQITVTLTADENGGSWTGRPADFGLPDFMAGWQWSEDEDNSTASGGAVSAVSWLLAISAGDVSIQFYPGSTMAVCTCGGTLSILYASGADNLGELLYAQAVKLPLA